MGALDTNVIRRMVVHVTIKIMMKILSYLSQARTPAVVQVRVFLQHFIGEDLKKSLESLNKAFYCYKPGIVRRVLITAL